MKTKIWLGVAIILVIGLAAGAYWWLRRPQVIKFSDDAKLTLLAVEYGKRHTPPAAKVPARVHHGPDGRRPPGQRLVHHDQ